MALFRQSVLFAALACLSAAGCTADSQPQRLGCLRTADCPAGEACQQGLCGPACVTVADCLSGFCDSTTGECVECLQDVDCSDGLICEGQACIEQVCTPGEVTCADSQGFKTCNERGDGYVETLCPDDLWCVEGECRFACPSSLTDCAGSCRDLQTDRTHCGGCDMACAAGEVCSMGACAISCGAGLTDCGGSCRDLQTDRTHCGGCDMACRAGEACMMGSCVVSCEAGLTDCGGSCRDVQTDRAHCGGCDMACGAGEVCSMGTCAPSCASGLSLCDGLCTNLSYDPSNCGVCGTACGSDEACVLGVCETLASAGPSFSGVTGAAWESVGSLGTRGLQTWVPAGETSIYYGSGSSFRRWDITAAASTSLASPPSSIASWGGPALVDGFLWEIVPPRVMRFEIATGSWTTLRSDLPGSSSDSMTVVDNSENLWVYNSSNQLIRYDISANTYEAFATGVSANTQTRVGYDATTNSLYFGGAFGGGFHRFDIATEAVTTLPSHPEGGLSDTFCTDRSGHVYAAGGCGGPSYFQFDIASNSWAPIVDSPLAGCNGSCVVHGDGWLYTEDSGTTHRLQLF